MTETIATIIVTCGSCVLFAYWFRYVCLLMLEAKTPRNHSNQVAAANRLAFPEVQARLPECGPHVVPLLQDALDRDYRLLVYLLDHGAPVEQSRALEIRMLRTHYRVMRAWCRVSRHWSSHTPRRAIEEMAAVVAHFAGMLGER